MKSQFTGFDIFFHMTLIVATCFIFESCATWLPGRMNVYQQYHVAYVDINSAAITYADSDFLKVKDTQEDLAMVGKQILAEVNKAGYIWKDLTGRDEGKAGLLIEIKPLELKKPDAGGAAGSAVIGLLMGNMTHAIGSARQAAASYYLKVDIRFIDRKQNKTIGDMRVQSEICQSEQECARQIAAHILRFIKTTPVDMAALK
jgi:hypothetical protein